MAALARVTLATLSDALAVQKNGFGSAVCVAKNSLMAAFNLGTLVDMPLRIRLSVVSRKIRAKMLSLYAIVGVKCIWKWGCLASHA